MAFKREAWRGSRIREGESNLEVACVENCGKIPDDRWQLKQPMEAKADAVKVRTLLRNLEELKVKTFTARQPLSSFRMAWITLGAGRHLAQRQGEPVTVLVGREDSTRAGAISSCRSAGGLLRRGKDAADLLKTAPELRDLKLLAFKARDVRKIEITQPDASIVLEGEGDTWNQVKPTKAKDEGIRCGAFMEAGRLGANCRKMNGRRRRLRRTSMDWEQPAATIITSWTKWEKLEA